ncbi:hypothetical protein HZS_5441 [Henneguya salminicola]|nr:hypothetical protein HZS_5441 [Henneguya salminicola]
MLVESLEERDPEQRETIKIIMNFTFFRIFLQNLNKKCANIFQNTRDHPMNKFWNMFGKLLQDFLRMLKNMQIKNFEPM